MGYDGLDGSDVTAMRDDEWLAGRFEENRTRLRGISYRMLGSRTDAEDAVQEAWLRVATGADGVTNLDGWFTTIVARICLDMLRSRKSRREVLPGEPDEATAETSGPEQEAVLADSVGLAMLVVLDRLVPAERVAFVLHDLFGVPFDEIAGITGRSTDAARQLASRARRRVRGEPPRAADPAKQADQETNLARQRAVTEAFLAASRAGDLTALLAVLDPDVRLHADQAALPPGYPNTLHGAAAVARGARFSAGRSRNSFIMLVDGVPGIAYAPGGRLAIVLAFTYTADTIDGIDVIADPARLDALELSVPD
jgi:RNA polymerase sigma factor (sigma-70 family)